MSITATIAPETTSRRCHHGRCSTMVATGRTYSTATDTAWLALLARDRAQHGVPVDDADYPVSFDGEHGPVARRQRRHRVLDRRRHVKANPVDRLVGIDRPHDPAQRQDVAPR